MGTTGVPFYYDLAGLSSQRLSVSDARKDLTKLIHVLEAEPDKIFELDRHESPLALLLSFEGYSPLIGAFQSGNIKALLAAFVANRWLGAKSVPVHLYKPQLKELGALESSELLLLSEADPGSSLDELKAMGKINEKVAERLVRRAAVAKTIRDAHESDLFEVAEELSNSQE